MGWLPGQPDVDFNQYGGYVTVDPKKGRALFYYFVESPQNSSMKPLLLWLNGGPGCSSVGGGAMQELGPFIVNADAKTLHRNTFSWNNVANVLFLESPAGVGFSYSNTTSDYKESGDKRTAEDSYTFLVNWFERFPQYKGREFFITGESYAGHYVPQLASTILSHSSSSNHTAINLRGIAIGNALIDDVTNDEGEFEFMWNHAMIPDEVYYNVLKHCNFSAESDEECEDAMNEIPDFGDISSRNIYSPPCHLVTCSSNIVRDQAADFDLCSGEYALNYLNDPPVQKALHARKTDWRIRNHLLKWNDAPDTVLSIIKQLISNGLPWWLYSGDVDALVPITSTRKSIRKLALPVSNSWRPWYSNHEVGGFVVEYKGLVLATVRGAGHFVPSNQPERALTMIYSFLQGKLPPANRDQGP